MQRNGISFYASLIMLSVAICVHLSPLVPDITLMKTISYNPLANGIGNYLFIILFHCAFPVFFVLLIRAIVDYVQRKCR